MVQVGDSKYLWGIFAVLGAVLYICSGCATVRITDPPETATQQFMTSEAVIQSIDQLSFQSIRGRKVFIDDGYLRETEKRFAAAQLRANILEAGAYIQEDRSDAEMIIEFRSGGVGIDRYESMAGIPSIEGVAFQTPEFAFTKSLRQVGYASFAYVAYWADSGEIVTSSGPYIGKTLRQDWWFFGFGPRTVGNVPVVDRTID